MPPLLLLGGTVFTADPHDSMADAVAIKGDRIVSVGPVEEVRRLHPGGTELDLEGRLVLPGFIDAHNHFLATGESLGSIDVRYPGVANVEELVTTIARVAANAEPGTWITAYGFDHAKYGREPTRWDLDRATTEQPVVVLHVSGHHALANSVALERRGITAETSDPEGGRIVRDERGLPTGLCLDAAMGLLQPTQVDIGHHGPNFHIDAPIGEHVDAVERAGRAFLQEGITTVCDAQVTTREMNAYREARCRGRLLVRTICMPLSHQLDDEGTLARMIRPFGDDHLRLGPMKFYADGSLIGGTACFTEPYGEDGEFDGLLYWQPDAFEAAVARAHGRGWQIGVHAQGDRAIGMTLDAFEAAHAASPRDDPRFRIEHAGYPTLDQIRRMARLGVVAVVQPSYLRDSGDEFLLRLGARAGGLQPLRDELDAGVRVVLSSDSDVASYRPFDTISAAVARRTRNGAPIGSDQALTIREAIRAHTIDAAFCLRTEDRLGSIEPGKLADLVILNDDPFAAAPEQIAGTGVWATILDGRVVAGSPDAVQAAGR